MCVSLCFWLKIHPCAAKQLSHGSGASVLLTWHVTMDAAMQELMRQNAELLMQLQQQNLQAFQQLIEQMRVDNRGVKGNHRDRVFREIGVFHGDEPRWKERSVKFRAAAKESNMKVFEALKWSEACTDEITAMDVANLLGERGPEISTMVYNRIFHHWEGHAVDDSARSCRRERSRSVEASEQALQSSDSDEGNPIDVEGHEPRQDLEGQGHPGVH